MGTHPFEQSIIKRPNRLTGKFKNCLNCQKEFYAPKWLLERNNGKDGGKFCSHKCYSLHKHDSPWNKGTKGLIKVNKGCFTDTKKIFQGTSNEYKSLHHLINKKFGSPKECENCKSTNAPIYDWANISGKYLKSRQDWRRLCRFCHFHYDKQDNRRAKYESNIL